MNWRVGLIVNAVAGVGGPTALRGSDGVAAEALALGAEPQALARAAEALRAMHELKPQLTLITGSGSLGADAAQAAGWSSEIVYRTSVPSSAEDSAALARRLSLMQVDLLLFAGGDGTARDVVECVGDTLPVLGIPAGVKMYSGVFATTPAAAGTLALRYLRSHLRRTRQCEVMDLDESDLRRDRIEPSLFGYASSPEDPRLLQGKKIRSPAGDSQQMQAIAASVIESMDPQRLYLIGPGSTTWAVKQGLQGQASMLGVDAYVGQRLVLKDATAAALTELTHERAAHAIVTCIGGQGHIFGRGNQQFSPEVVRRIGRRRVSVLATPAKLMSLAGRAFIADLDDAAAAAEMTGHVEVISGYQSKAFYRCEAF
ncbi:MAG: NAD(+)/NADH kinase [Caldimonas sp.]